MNSSFGTIRQLGFVVPDVHAAMRHWIEGPGAGPFYFIENAAVTDNTFRGRPSEGPQVSIGLGQHGPVQIELIQQHCQRPSAYRPFIEAVREGLHHVAYWTEHYDELLATALSRGYVEIQAGRSGRGGPDDRFSYLESGAHHGSMIEVSEMGTEKRALFDAIAHASVDWDGAQPVRDVADLRAQLAHLQNGGSR